VLRERLSQRDLQAIGVVFSLRTTARQVDNVVTEWLAGSAGSPARFQILALLTASRGRGVPHKEIIAALKVTGATVSEQMAGLARDGLVKSTVDPEDRRNLIAKLTAKGQAMMDRAFEANAIRLRVAFASLSMDELATFTSLLQRIGQSFEASGGKYDNLLSLQVTRPGDPGKRPARQRAVRVRGMAGNGVRS
jgi:DNA-binding MarR family transcriptional regulator